MTIVDTSQLNAFCRGMQAKPYGVKFWDAMLYEVGKVLEGCVRLTTADKFDKIKRSVEFKNRTLRFGGKGSGPAIIYVTKKGVVWFADEPGAGYEGVAKGRTSAGKTFHPMTEFFHYGNPRWGRYQEFLQQLRDKQVDVRQVLGRAGQSWVQIAESLGLQIQAPDYVRNAPPFKGVKYVNGVSKKVRTVDSIFIEMKNLDPVFLGTIDGARILQTSINGRAKYFSHGISDAYVNEVKAFARQFSSLRAA